jgi:hypothetical protein
MEIASGFLVFMDAPAGRCVADAADALLHARVADLLGAPLTFQQSLDLMPLGGAKPLPTTLA